MNKGVAAAFGAYVIWGFLPIYWHLLATVSPAEILANRIIWSFLLLVVFLTLRKDWAWARPALQNKKTILSFVAASLLLSTNWFIYIWAVNAGHVIETSLGYFINPLVVIVFGVVFLHERMRPYQIAAVGLAACGVLYLTWMHGQIPWIAISLAVSFGLYGLLKKIGALNSLRGLTLETAVMSLPALAFLLFVESNGTAALGHQSPQVNLMLVMSGLVTSLPLVLFGYGAQKIPLYMVGLAQYIAPTIQFFLGLFWFHEEFIPAQLPGYILVWIALGIYSFGELWGWRQRLMIERNLRAQSAGSTEAQASGAAAPGK